MNATKQTMVNVPVRDINGRTHLRQCKSKLSNQRPIRRYHIDNDLLDKTERDLRIIKLIRLVTSGD